MTTQTQVSTAPKKRKISPAVKFLWVVAALTAIAVIGFVVYQAFLPQLMRLTYVPTVSFQESPQDQAPDYASLESWAAHPAKPGVARDVPPNYTAAPMPAVDVFFVPPTTFTRKDRWNAQLSDPAYRGMLNQMLRHQSTVFNGVGHIWAPHYRQATLGAFLTNDPDRAKALTLAYGDVSSAFETFLKATGDKPFIIAAHSQGSLHALSLLQKRIAGTPLQKRLVAAYLIGWPISTTADLEPLGLKPCATPAATGCVISWQSFGEPAEPKDVIAVYNAGRGPTGLMRMHTPMVCVNPLSWWADTRRIEAPENLGALPFADAKESLGQVQPGLTGAACDAAGILHLTQNPESPYRAFLFPGQNYHVYDYNLFWANIRANVQTRVEAFFSPRY